MKHYFYLFCVLITLSVQLYGQTHKCDSVSLKFIGAREENYEFEINNNTKDTLYLFDTYLNDHLYQSRYLHRFDQKTKENKLSLLPLLPFLTLTTSDVLILGDRRVGAKFQLLYHFTPIAPNSKHKIAMHKTAFLSKDYVKEVYPQKVSKFDNIKFRRIKYKEGRPLVIEFALYTNIELLTSKDAYYCDEFNFNKQALSYVVLSVEINH